VGAQYDALVRLGGETGAQVEKSDVFSEPRDMVLERIGLNDGGVSAQVRFEEGEAGIVGGGARATGTERDLPLDPPEGALPIEGRRGGTPARRDQRSDDEERDREPRTRTAR